MTTNTSIIQLNVGGVTYTTTTTTLKREPQSLLNSVADGHLKELAKLGILPTTDGTIFIDRDGILFRYVLDYLRSGKLLLPIQFKELAQLKDEAKFYRLEAMFGQVKSRGANENGPVHRPIQGGHITIGYRGTFAFGRDGQADVKFRKLNRILICGKAALCREVFGETLNESRDPDREGSERYTSRLYLKHQSLEKAFDALADKGFQMLCCCASGANGGVGGGVGGMPMLPLNTGAGSASSMDLQANRTNGDFEEQRWSHYTEFVFRREESN